MLCQIETKQQASALESLKSIAKGQGLNFKEEHYDRLDDIGVGYFLRKTFNDGAMRPAQEARKLGKVCKHLDSALKDLQGLDPVFRDYVSEIVPGQPDEIVPGNNLQRFESLLDNARVQFNGLADKVSKYSKRGRPKKYAERAFIWELADLYEETEGREARLSNKPYTKDYSGPFWRFCKECLQIIDVDHASDPGLYQTIRQVLVDRKKGEKEK